MKKHKRLYAAFFTVEASFIVPMAFLLIMVMLQYGFFCYEKTVSLQCCYLAALRGTNEWELSGSRLENYVKEEFYELLEDRSLYKLEGEAAIREILTGVEVSFDTYMKVPFSDIRGDSVEGWKIHNTKKAKRTIPSTYIRRYQMITDSGGTDEGSNHQE